MILKRKNKKTPPEEEFSSPSERPTQMAIALLSHLLVSMI